MANKKKSKTRKSSKQMTISKARIKKVVMNMAEKKYFNQTLFSGSLSAITWTFGSFLAGLQQGTAATNRIGNVIRVHAIYAQVVIDTTVASVNTGGSVCKWIVYHNKEAVGAVPTGAQIYDADNFSALRNVILMPRFKVMREGSHSMVVTSATTVPGNYSTGPAHMFMVAIYPKKKIDYQSNAGTISDLFKDDYGFGFVAGHANCCSFTVKTKVVFSDE